jgi:hypothetical protein
MASVAAISSSRNRMRASDDCQLICSIPRDTHLTIGELSYPCILLFCHLISPSREIICTPFEREHDTRNLHQQTQRRPITIAAWRCRNFANLPFVDNNRENTHHTRSKDHHFLLHPPSLGCRPLSFFYGTLFTCIASLSFQQILYFGLCHHENIYSTKCPGTAERSCYSTVSQRAIRSMLHLSTRSNPLGLHSDSLHYHR